MTQEHPITPSQELVNKWVAMLEYCEDIDVFSDIARWGADQELEACCEWLETDPYGFSIEATAPSMTKRLRAARRPKLPSLKEQALKELKDWTDEKHGPGGEVFLCEGLSVALIREALESLPD